MTDRDPTPSGTIIDGISTSGGVHCETSTLDVLLRHVGVNLSEPMLFGLGEGLGFVYWDSKRQQFPFIGGRVQPGNIAAVATRRLGVAATPRRTSSPRVGWRTVRTALDAGSPVGLQLDSYHLEYFTNRTHFAGHFVAMYGYDDTTAYLVDTQQQGGAVTTSLDSLARARSEKGSMYGKHLSFVLSPPAAPPDVAALVLPAIQANAQTFLNPAIRNLGYRGIDRAADEVPSWLSRTNEPETDLPLAATLMERAGTGGSIFRRIYRDFLAEAMELVDAPALESAHTQFEPIVTAWQDVAHLIAQAGSTHDTAHLHQASKLLRELARLEHHAMVTLHEGLHTN